MNPKPNLPRDAAAAEYVVSVAEGGCDFPRNKGEWRSDLETSYQQGWEDALAWLAGKPRKVIET